MNLDNRKILVEIKGGSHAYGLATAKSDIDIRGIFVNTDAAHLVGLKRDEVLVSQDGEKDVVYTEFRHALRLLRSANTQMIELLYMTEWESNSQEWINVMCNRPSLIDSHKLFNSLRGYMQGERRLANGERTGKLGGKRKTAIDEYGFSPKNFVQLIRLAWAGSMFFQEDHFPVNVSLEDKDLAALLLDIKTNPSKFTKDGLNKMAEEWERVLVAAFDNRQYTHEFNEEIATQLCLSVYGPLIRGL